MTISRFRGLCHHCGHDHDADNEAFQKALEAAQSEIAPHTNEDEEQRDVREAWVEIMRGFHGSELQQPGGYPSYLELAKAIVRQHQALHSASERTLPALLREASAFLMERNKPTLAGDCITCADVIEEIMTDDAKLK